MDILRFKYDNDTVALEKWLEKMLPVARWSARARDTTVLIEDGESVTDNIDSTLEKYEVKAHRTIGLFGHYQITFSSSALFQATQFLTSPSECIKYELTPFVKTSMLPEGGQNPNMDIETFRDPIMEAFWKIDEARRLLERLVLKRQFDSSIQEDGIARRLIGPIERYCTNTLDYRVPMPEWAITGQVSPMYERSLDMSYGPAYYYLTFREVWQASATAMCKVCMSEPLSKGIFDILTSFSGTGFRLDVGLVVDIEVKEDKESIDRIRLLLVNGTVEKLVEQCHNNRAVAFVAREKIKNRLQHLQVLQRYVTQPEDAPHNREDNVETYSALRESIEYSINVLQNARDTVAEVLGSEREHQCKEEHMAEACEMLLNNSTFVELCEGTVADSLEFPIEGFLGLKLGPDLENVLLTTDEMQRIYYSIETEYVMRSSQLERIGLPISIIVTRECIAPERYDAFVRKQGPDFDAIGFENGDSLQCEKGKISMCFFTDEVVRHWALQYDCGLEGHSKRIITAAALQWVIELSRDRGFICNLAGDLGYL